MPAIITFMAASHAEWESLNCFHMLIHSPRGSLDARRVLSHQRRCWLESGREDEEEKSGQETSWEDDISHAVYKEGGPGR